MVRSLPLLHIVVVEVHVAVDLLLHHPLDVDVEGCDEGIPGVRLDDAPLNVIRGVLIPVGVAPPLLPGQFVIVVALKAVAGCASLFRGKADHFHAERPERVLPLIDLLKANAHNSFLLRRRAVKSGLRLRALQSVFLIIGDFLKRVLCDFDLLVKIAQVEGEAFLVADTENDRLSSSVLRVYRAQGIVAQVLLFLLCKNAQKILPVKPVDTHKRP